MGQISSALLLPETEPSACKMASLLYFFKSISFYLPTESDAAARNPSDLFENLCSAYVPAPLHEDLARFNRLLHEMGTSRSDDLARLFSAAKAPVATGQIRDKDEASSSSVFSALQSETDMKISAVRKERLWQARLILKLAEILDRRETEVRQGLARIALSEQRVFASLEGISDVDADDLAALPGFDKLKQAAATKPGFAELTMGATALLAPLRVKAWAELFLVDSRSHRPTVLVAANADCGSILLDGYEDKWRRSPQKIFTLSLPVFCGLDTDKSFKNDYLKSRNKLRAAAIVQLEYFESFFKKAATLVQPLSGSQIPILTEHVDAWNKTAESVFPTIATGIKTLDFYSMPGISPASLFQRVFHLGTALPVIQQDPPAIILAVLKE